MDDTVFVILLLTGFCVPSASSTLAYPFIREEMTWDDAQNYCITKYAKMVQILDEVNVTTMMNTPTGGYTDKAWIGLYRNAANWTWVDGQPATYYRWGTGQPDNTIASESCVCMTHSGTWKTDSCSEKKPAVCFNGTGQTSLSEKNLTWTEAKNYCENQSSILAIVPNKRADFTIRKELSVKEDAWIGLNRPKLWYWSDTGDSEVNYTFTNWKPGQPDNLNQEQGCAAVVVKDGTWTDEDCSAAFPFFCYGIQKSKKTAVRITILSSANMEDPTYSADLQQQLVAAFVNQRLTDFKLTWKKLPVKQTQESRDNNRRRLKLRERCDAP